MILLAKFFDEEKWADEFINEGSMKFTSNVIFREYEEKEIRGDSLEGFNKNTFIIPYDKINETITISSPNNGKSFYLPNLKDAITKTIINKYNVPKEDIKILKFKEEDIVLNLEYLSEELLYCITVIEKNKKPDINSLIKLGEYCVLVYGVKDFLNAVDSLLYSKTSYYKRDRVQYLDINNINDSFHKSSKYVSQNEYRFSIFHKEKRYIENIFCKIGNISKIAFKIKTIDLSLKLENIRFALKKIYGADAFSNSI